MLIDFFYYNIQITIAYKITSFLKMFAFEFQNIILIKNIQLKQINLIKLKLMQLKQINSTYNIYLLCTDEKNTI